MNLFITILFASSLSAFSEDTLRGKSYTFCDAPTAPFEIEYVVEFLPSGEEFEAEVYREKSEKACKGRPLFALGRVWRYEINKNELVTTLKKVKVILIQPRLLEFFNKTGICGHHFWKVDEMVSCDGKFIFDFEPSIGDITTHQFKQLQNKLIIHDGDEDVFELKERSSGL
jgi:hypothetical protein